ncbi:MAG: hypothetical protein GXP42_04555 [Chloroflexi bacterium]|nr:hypothetical protein [Chloroflexota bacterium]
MSDGERFLILGGGGLVGLQVARRVASDLKPSLIVIAALYENEVREALESLENMFGGRGIRFDGAWGNIFVREELARATRGELLGSYERREAMYDDLLGPLDQAYEKSFLVELVRRFEPDVIIDCINTATAISYQDVYTASHNAKYHFDRLLDHLKEENGPVSDELREKAEIAFERMVISQEIPQLIRHVILLNQVLREVGVRLYVKVGTTGTGGMGLNIPYTHGEDKPSPTLMSKTAVAFAHTGLMFLMARTVGGPIVKELKPGAMIGYADVAYRPIRERGQVVHVYDSHADALNNRLDTRRPVSEFEDLGELVLPVVDTGENGLFTRGEFEAITSLRQMEFITPEEVAREVVLEVMGSNTGYDVIAAINSAVMNPTYRAGFLRQQALDELAHLEEEAGVYSVALGQLGPPQLSKLLWESQLLRLVYGTLPEVLEHSAEEIAQRLYAFVREHDDVRHTITSIGVPVLAPDGKTLIRGPFIRIPEHPAVDSYSVDIREGDIDRWASKGWVDLRPANMERWRRRFETMARIRQQIRLKGSAAITREGYLWDDIRPGSIVGWIFNNEEQAYRIK